MQRITFLFIVFCIFAIHCYANKQEIEYYTNKDFCKSISQNFCNILQDLIQALEILEKIQHSNMVLLQQTMVKSNQTEHIQVDHRVLQKDQLVVISASEYRDLKKYMRKFCKGFKKLGDYEKNLLFLLQWNGKFLFSNERDILMFCKTRYSN